MREIPRSKISRGESSRRDACATTLMRVAPSHGTTMGYVSGPFRTEEQNPTLKYIDRFCIGTPTDDRP